MAMIRRLIVLFAVVVASPVAAVPVAASAGTVTQTVHFTSQPLIAANMPCSVDAGLIVVNEDNGNGVIHFTANSNGFWATGTYAGDVQIFPALSVTVDPTTGIVTSFVPDASRPTAQGRVTTWFGVSANRTDGVSHDTINAMVTTSDGQSFAFHAVDHIQVAFPSLTVTHQFSDFHC
jgi:hypothetical protein